MAKTTRLFELNDFLKLDKLGVKFLAKHSGASFNLSFDINFDETLTPVTNLAFSKRV